MASVKPCEFELGLRGPPRDNTVMVALVDLVPERASPDPSLCRFGVNQGWFLVYLDVAYSWSGMTSNRRGEYRTTCDNGIISGE